MRGGRGGGGAGVRGEWLGGRKEVGEQEGGGEGRREVGVVVWVGAGRRGGGRGGEAAATPSTTPRQVALHSSAGPLLPAATPSMTPWQVAPSYLQPAPPPKSRLLAAGVGPTRRRHEAAHQNPGQRVWPPQVMRVHAQRPCIHAIQVSGCGLHK